MSKEDLMNELGAKSASNGMMGGPGSGRKPGNGGEHTFSQDKGRIRDAYKPENSSKDVSSLSHLGEDFTTPSPIHANFPTPLDDSDEAVNKKLKEVMYHADDRDRHYKMAKSMENSLGNAHPNVKSERKLGDQSDSNYNKAQDELSTLYRSRLNKGK